MDDCYLFCICDDNSIFSEKLAKDILKLTEKYTTVKCEIRIFNDPQEMIIENAFEKYNAVFMDIEMPGLSGDNLVRKFRDRFPEQEVIYVSAFDNLVFSSIDTKPLAFVRKNESIYNEDLSRAVKLLLNNLELKKHRDFFQLKDGNYILLRIDNIVFFEATGRSTVMHFFDDKKELKKTTISGSIGSIEKKYEAKGFIKAHRSYLINYKYIYLINKGEIITKIESLSLPVSKYRLEEVKKNYFDNKRKFG